MSTAIRSRCFEGAASERGVERENGLRMLITDRIDTWARYRSMVRRSITPNGSGKTVSTN